MEEHDETRYNGWTNYETWTVGLWLDNEEASYRYWRKAAAKCKDEAGDCSLVWNGEGTINEVAASILAENLKREVNAASPLQHPSMYGDLLSGALAEVNWYQIADHWMSE